MIEKTLLPMGTLRREAMGNYFLLNTVEKWAAVCIPKNGCSTLKAGVLEQANIPFKNHAEIHSTIGYSEQSPFLTPISNGPPEDYFRFAIWRNPIDRFISVYQQFILDGVSHRRFNDKSGFGFDQFIDFTAWEHRKEIEKQDEHLRAQSNFFRPEEVDTIVRIETLDVWFKNRKWPLPSRKNPSTSIFVPTSRQLRRVKRLYEADYCIEEYLNDDLQDN